MVKRALTPGNIVLYLVLAVIAYGIVVYIFSRNTGRSLLPGGAPTTSNRTTITLTAENDSAEMGIATLESLNNGTQTRVTLDVKNTPNEPQPAHIHVGACPNVGEVKYDLNDVAGGKSETVIDAAYEALKNMGPLAINVHKSVAEQTVYVSCGNLTF